MKYVLNVYKKIAGAMEAEIATKMYAEQIGAEVIYSEKEVPKGSDIIYVDGYDLYYTTNITFKPLNNNKRTLEQKEKEIGKVLKQQKIIKEQQEVLNKISNKRSDRNE